MHAKPRRPHMMWKHASCLCQSSICVSLGALCCTFLLLQTCVSSVPSCTGNIACCFLDTGLTGVISSAVIEHLPVEYWWVVHCWWCVRFENEGTSIACIVTEMLWNIWSREWPWRCHICLPYNISSGLWIEYAASIYRWGDCIFDFSKLSKEKVAWSRDCRKLLP